MSENKAPQTEFPFALRCRVGFDRCLRLWLVKGSGQPVLRAPRAPRGRNNLAGTLPCLWILEGFVCV